MQTRQFRHTDRVKVSRPRTLGPLAGRDAVLDSASGALDEKGHG